MSVKLAQAHCHTYVRVVMTLCYKLATFFYALLGVAAAQFSI